MFQLFIFVALFLTCKSQSDSYYVTIDPVTMKDDDLKGALQKLTFDHKVLSYNAIWGAFDRIELQDTDRPCSEANSTLIADVYSSYCWKPEHNVSGGECGNYHVEGDCFNREHLWPKSWFGGFDAGEGAQTDLWELYPSDGYVNGLRGNLPLGMVTCLEDASYVSSNGSKIGPCAGDTGGYTGKCFEPATHLKGDFARSYFYLSVTYWKKWACCDTATNNASDIKPWAETLLRAWHVQDPVDDLERKKNTIIFEQYQNNRNPFVDHPEWVDLISDF